MKATQGASDLEAMVMDAMKLTLVILAGSVLAGCASGGGAPPAALTGPITLHDFSFDPAAATVKVGTMVTWKNLDGYAHTVTSDKAGGPLDSGDIAGGAEWSFTFTQAGTYDYHCKPHANQDAQDAWHGMTARLIVEP